VRVRDRVVVVTGGASGIGRALCRRFAAEGAKGVVVADQNAAGAQAVAREISGLGVGCDVSSEKEIGALVRQAEAAYGPIEVFFSNAGVATGGDPLTTPLDVWQRQWEINFMAHVYAVRAVLPGMLERGSGYLLHTASMAGILTSQRNAVYAVTKHAVVGFAEWLSITYHHRGIRVSCLAPLGVRTPMLGDPSSPWARASVGPVKEPEDVAGMVVDAMAEERFLILTDPIAQEWMQRKTNDPERWLRGMRRIQVELEKSGG
jgi:NAD(P)-dependent dehydrogenase (short-subunit alcohol dehydrogenase family)